MIIGILLVPVYIALILASLSPSVPCWNGFRFSNQKNMNTSRSPSKFLIKSRNEKIQKLFYTIGMMVPFEFETLVCEWNWFLIEFNILALLFFRNWDHIIFMLRNKFFKFIPTYYLVATNSARIFADTSVYTLVAWFQVCRNILQFSWIYTIIHKST